MKNQDYKYESKFIIDKKFFYFFKKYNQTFIEKKILKKEH